MKALGTKLASLIFIIMFLFVSLFKCGVSMLKDRDRYETNDDGFYCHFSNSENGVKVYILGIPDGEELIIPEYIEGHYVDSLGMSYSNFFAESTKYRINGKNTKKLTIQHPIDIYEYEGDEYVNFPNLTNLTFIDFMYVNQQSSKEELMVPHYVGARTSNFPRVELKNSGREFSLEEFKPKTILIPEYVEVIEAGVFDGLTDVVIKTSYESKPEGWEDGWNGDCEVIWGEEITYRYYYDWIKTTEDGFKYYYDETTNEGAYILKIPNIEELVIPEYINGKKVLKLGHIFDNGREYGIHGTEAKKLTIQHEFDLHEDIVKFRYLTNLTFIDYLYCNLSSTKRTLVVPCYIGEDNNNVSSVELRKSDREYSLENFKPKVIVIPEYVTVIEAGVFDGLTDVVIKTAYKSQPEGWEDGWNGDCEVIWEAQFN